MGSKYLYFKLIVDQLISCKLYDVNICRCYFPSQGEELALIALRRMARDKNNEIKLQYSTELENSANIDTFIATATSPTQRVRSLISYRSFCSGIIYKKELTRLKSTEKYSIIS